MLTVLIGLSRIILFVVKIGLAFALTASIGAIITIIILQIDCYREYKKFCELTKEDLLELLEPETLWACFCIGLIFYIFICVCYLIGALVL